MEMNDKAQVHTLEGFMASGLMILAVMLAAKSSLIVTPQSELTMDVQLQETANDALAVLDMAPETTFQSNLTELVAGYSIEVFENEIDTQLKDVIYNVDFACVNESRQLVVYHFIINGSPLENSVVATRLVTLYKYNATVIQTNCEWEDSTDPKVVEVRLTAWRV